MCVPGLSGMPVNHSGFFQLHRHEEPNGAQRVGLINAKAGLGKAGQNGASSPPDDVKESSPQRKGDLTATGSWFCSQSSRAWEHRPGRACPPADPPGVLSTAPRTQSSLAPLSAPAHRSAKAAETGEGKKRGRHLPLY